MSGFDNQTNRGRAAKIVEILGHLEVSARSNRAKPEELAELLNPVWDQLGAMGIASAVVAAEIPERAPEPAPEVPQKGTRAYSSPEGSISKFLDGLSNEGLLDVLYDAAIRIDINLRKKD